MKKKNIIKKRIKRFFIKIIKKNLLLKQSKVKQRLFYYDFFFNKFEQKLFLLKKRISITFLWKNILNSMNTSSYR